MAEVALMPDVMGRAWMTFYNGPVFCPRMNLGHVGEGKEVKGGLRTLPYCNPVRSS
jgi:hypothetical protein